MSSTIYSRVGWWGVLAVVWCSFWSVGTPCQAQTTNFQNAVTKCFSGASPTITNSQGTNIGSVTFGPGDIPAGHRISEIVIEVVWSKTNDGSCGSASATPTDLSHVGFGILGPVGGVRYLATSAATSALGTVSTTSSFVGTSNILNDTIVFKAGASSLLPATLPVPGRDTVRSNADPLDYYFGQNPLGTWRLIAIDDPPGPGPQLCVSSYCITLVTCAADELQVSCQQYVELPLPSAGSRTLAFADLDSISDVSCRIKNISFSPPTLTCADLNTPQPVTMTIRDYLDSVRSCTSTVLVTDTTAPSLIGCAPNVFATLYLDDMGRDTFWADSIQAIDDCGTGALIKEVRPIAGPQPWGSFLAFNCRPGLQQFRARVTDQSGNSAECRLFVNILDTVQPTAVCGSYTAYLSNAPNGAVTVAALQVDGGSFDVCPPVIGRWIGNQFDPPPVYTCADLGMDTVRLVVADISGNTDHCDSAIIHVADTIPPVAACQTDTLYLDVNGQAVLYPINIDGGSTDICGIASRNINGFDSLVFNCSHVNAPQLVVLNVFDQSGNWDSCQTNVVIMDTLPPTAQCANDTIFIAPGGTATVFALELDGGSSDLCTGSNISVSIGGQPSLDFSCADIGNNPNPVVLTVRDTFGNQSTCTAQVTVRDTIDPVAICANPTIQLNSAGIATLFARDLSAGSTDNCNSIQDSFVNTIGNNFITFDCSALFTPQSAQLVVLDHMGNTDVCTAQVTVEDTIRPTALCRGTYVAGLDAFGVATVLPSNIDSNSTDNCGITQYLINNSTQVQYTCVDLGTQMATLTVEDAAGNRQLCQARIEVVDNFQPSVSCQSITAPLGSAGTATIFPNDVVNSVSDNCGIASRSFNVGNSITYTCDSLGPRIVTVIVTDNYSNTAQCVTTVFVTDTTSPQANCRPVPYTVQLDSNGMGYVTGANLDNGSSDLCGVERLLVNGGDSLLFTCAQIGNASVTLTVLDSTGNLDNCIASVVVNDPISPMANCRDTLVYLSNGGVATVTAAMLDAGSTDNCNYTTSINGSSSVQLFCNQIGINTIQLTVTDGSGNINQCPANVTVVDTTRPVAICVGAGGLTVYLDSTCFASVPATIFNNGSTDGCGSNNLNYSINGLPNAVFNASNLSTNPNPITLMVRDASGNAAQCPTSVWVRDTIHPVAVCRPDTLQLAGATVQLTPMRINAGSVDNCGPVSNLTLNGRSFLTFDCNDLGSNTVVLTAEDFSGNASTCTTTVFIEDVEPPVVRCNNTVTIALDPATDTALLTPAMVDNGSVDNCVIGTYGLSRSAFDCNDVIGSPLPVQLYVTDQSGNLDSCATQLIVEDTIRPVAICQPDTLYFVGIPVGITPAAVDGGSVDNCSLVQYQLSQDTFACPDIGLNTVQLTVTDQSGNSASCWADVLLLDTTATADAGLEQVLCDGVDSTILNARPPSALLTGTWSSNSGATFSGANDPNAQLTNLQPGDNVFYWTISNATCARLSEDSVNIIVVVPSTDSADAGLDQAWCDQTTITLDAAVPTNSTGRWLQSHIQQHSGVTLADSTRPNTTVTGLLPGNSYAFVWELVNGRCGAYDRDTVIMDIDELPNDVAEAGNDITCSPDSVVLNGSVPMLGTGRWSTPGTSIIRSPNLPSSVVTAFPQDTNAFVYALSNGSCMDYSIDTVYVILDDVWPILTADSFSLVPDGTTDQVNVILNDAIPPNWTIDLVQPIQTGYIVSLNTGVFEVDINEAVLNQVFLYEVCNGDCPIVCDTAEVLLAIQPPGDCYAPTAFTPNNDGSNDVFVIPCINNISEKAALYIFNRWGNVVYETDNYSNDWDGTHRNQPLPDGTYFYILQIENKRPQNGSIELKR